MIMWYMYMMYMNFFAQELWVFSALTMIITFYLLYSYWMVCTFNLLEKSYKCVVWWGVGWTLEEKLKIQCLYANMTFYFHWHFDWNSVSSERLLKYIYLAFLLSSNKRNTRDFVFQCKLYKWINKIWFRVNERNFLFSVNKVSCFYIVMCLSMINWFHAISWHFQTLLYTLIRYMTNVGNLWLNCYVL